MATSKPLYRPDMNTEIASSDVLFHVDIAATANQPEPDLFNALSRLLQETSIIEVAYSFQEQTAYLATLYTMLVLGIVLFLLRYANRSLFRWHTWVNIFVSYYCAIGILVLIPLDLAVTKLQREARTVESYDLLSIYSNSLFFLYGCLFWPAQVVAGVLLYFFEEYNESGYFTVTNRILDALRNIGRFLLLCLLVGGVGFGILLGRGYVSDEKALLVTVVTVNNTYGLIAIMSTLHAHRPQPLVPRLHCLRHPLRPFSTPRGRRNGNRARPKDQSQVPLLPCSALLQASPSFGV
ncbi:hypothetical protein NGA_0444200 [Nannochloropsis gaditana CCMP526]|uniref:uncharacterized protein n=1 Tax=Nannochloropsis gaditana (strain CCMP526) TaxID=1093141 RepID=UPI00029F56AE|nr:hypothetical protein NGA_0444200 [Nannochloropsis gaditana CCMP526]EKU22658.1 hypothetical protein NGA_0444200 [Nannochloropsis gaditana CCMP526]|eukprot:XP_005853703.1 hypothetical protein NGA_0444200 [Nannochloropsis gaditana CCMP526]